MPNEVAIADVQNPEKTESVSGLSILLLRVALSGIFIAAGLGHLFATDVMTARAQAAPFAEIATVFGDARLSVLLSGYALLIGGVALLLGVFTRWAATGLFLVLIPITFAVQVGVGILHGPLWKNVALFGALLFFMLNDIKSYNLYPK